MKRAVDYLAHVDLHGLFEVYVLASGRETRMQFYPYEALKEDFGAYLARRFAHLGEPSDCVYHPEARCFEVSFRNLPIKDPEEALKAVTGPYPPTAGGTPAPP